MRPEEFTKLVKEIDLKIVMERVRLFFTSPRDAWRAVKNLNPSVDIVMSQDLLVVAAVASCAEFIRGAFANSKILFFGQEQYTTVSAFGHALLMFFMVMLTTYLVSSVIDFVATTEMFSADSERETSFQLVAYTTIVALIGQIALFIPVIGTLLCFAGFVYAIYLLYMGIEELFQVEKRPRFFAAVLLCWFAVLLLVGLVQNLMFPAPVVIR